MPNLTRIPFGLPGQIYRSPMPFGDFDYGHSTLEEYRQAGIDTVVMLITTEESLVRAGCDLEALYESEGMHVIHLPIIDFDVPNDDTAMETALDEVIAQAELGKNIAIHCFAGRGRTGMFIALLARRVLGIEGLQAITWLREYFPAVETEEQAQVVINYTPKE
jgi:protein-tyrosine phosphatase